MKVAVVFVLLFAAVLCRPARKVSDSSSDSSEEVVRRPAPPAVRKQAVVAAKHRAKPVQNVVAAAAAAGSDESSETSEENQGVAVEKATVEFKAAGVDTNAAPVSDKGTNSQDSDDDDDDEAEESEAEEEEDESDSDSESGESSTPAPGTVSPVVVTVEPLPGTTVDTILPTIVTDPDAGRGDNLGGYPGDYKSIYVEEKTYHKMSGPYKSYEFVDSGKKTGYDMTDGNEVEKSPKVYKVQAFHTQSQLLEEDTSTPEVETQSLDVSSGTSQDQDISHRQASLPEEASTTSESDSSSTPEEEGEESASSTSSSASAESDDEESQSNEETTATPGAADSDSDESESSEGDSNEEGEGPDATADMPAVLTAK
ncbi:osteopontin isoform X1 [Nothobranchius furzeri]|uniref:Osteopontin-like n=2 Tax=Nothobranchius furzeri TaxID=105023 RepID=A0A9D3BS68_NOTFU|nr:osteopontin-like [Nothobranchius furzeri]